MGSTMLARAGRFKPLVVVFAVLLAGYRGTVDDGDHGINGAVLLDVRPFAPGHRRLDVNNRPFFPNIVVRIRAGPYPVLNPAKNEMRFEFRRHTAQQLQ